jgi:hypothetical protein
MTEEETKDWFKFRSFVTGQLEHFIDRQNFIGLGVDPSFERTERLFVSRWTKNFKWTYKTWDSIRDYQRIESSQEEKLKLKFGKQIPTIHSIQGELEDGFYSETATILEKLELKSFVKFDRFGLDGTSRTIFVGDRFRESTFSWWEDLPREWIGLQPILDDLTKNLEIARKELRRKLGSS